jgi:hypothetical protein
LILARRLRNDEGTVFKSMLLGGIKENDGGGEFNYNIL